MEVNQTITPVYHLRKNYNIKNYISQFNGKEQNAVYCIIKLIYLRIEIFCSYMGLWHLADYAATKKRIDKSPRKGPRRTGK